MVSRSRPALLGTIALVVLGALTACIPGDAPSTTDSQNAAPVDPASLPPECAKANMAVKNPGKLIIATSTKATSPWFADDKPENGKGFEAAVATAIAEKLGFVSTDLTWKRVAPDMLTAPGLKEFDFGIGQVPRTEATGQAVEFSAPYYNVRQVVVALKSSTIADAKNFGDLKEAKLGAQASTASYDLITKVVVPNPAPLTFDGAAAAKKGLQDGSVDGLVVDLPAGFGLVSEIKDSVIVGQLPLAVAKPDQFSLTMEQGAPVNACLSRAIEALRATKVLEQLEKQWITEAAAAPELA